MEQIFQVNSSSFQDVEISASMRAGPNSILDFTQASIVTGSFSGHGSNLIGITASYIEPSATSSYALTASVALNAISSMSSILSISASWVSASIRITTADTASYITASNITGRVENATQALFATSSISSSIALSSSYIIPGTTLYVVSGSDGFPPSYIEPYDIPTVPYNPPYKEGRMFYDKDYSNWVYYTDQDFKLHIGKEVIWRIHNPYTTTLATGTPVYLSGSFGINPNAYKAIADGTNTKSDVVGVIRYNTLSGSTGYVLQVGVLHGMDMDGFAIGDQLWLSSTTPGALVNVDPGQPFESVRVGICQVDGVDGSMICDARKDALPSNAYAGMTSIPTLVDNTSSLEFYVGAGTVNLYTDSTATGIIYSYPILPITFSVPTSTTASFIYATTNGLTASYALTNNFTSINGINKVQVATIYRADEEIHWIELNSEGLALSNKIGNRLLNTDKFGYESGFSLYETGSRQFIVTGGSVWFGATRVSQDIFDSRLTESVALPILYSETHFAYHSASAWIIPIVSDGTYNNSYYDDGNNLIPLSNGYYTVNYFFRILGDNFIDRDVFYLSGNNQYSDLASAENDTVPASIPGVLSDVSILVGRIIILSGSNTATKVESAFTTNFGTSIVSSHNNLSGIQGGQGGEYYHLTSAEYTGVGNGTFVRQTAASLYGAAVTGSLLGTSSWARNSISSSYANTSSWAINAINGGTTLVTASTYPITSSWSISSSYAANVNLNAVPSASWVSASVKITTSDTASYISSSATFDNNGRIYNLSASYSTIAGTANAINFVPLTSTSASWVSASVRITTANTASYISSSSTFDSGKIYNLSSSYATIANSINFVPATAASASWVSASTKITTADTASYISSSAIFDVSKVYNHTASYSTVAGTSNTISFIPTTAVSASWVSASVRITTADTSSYISSSATFDNNKIYNLSSSYATTASYIPLIFTRGGTIYDPLGIAGTAATSQSICVWRCPFSCTVTNVWGHRMTGSGAVVNAIRVDSAGIISGSIAATNISLTTNNTWISASSLNIASSSFGSGDELYIQLVSSSAYPTQISIQLDFIR